MASKDEILRKETAQLNIPSWTQMWGLVIVTLLGLGLRLYRLGDWSFWIEEHHSIRTAFEMEWSLSGLMSLIRPVYFLFLTPVLNWLGVTEWSARLVAMLAGVLSIPLVYLLALRLLRSRTVALLSALLMALAPWHIYWSQNARFYTLLLLLCLLSFLTFYQGVKSNQQRNFVLSVIFLGLAGATHAVALLMLPVFVVYMLLIHFLPWQRPAGANFRNLLAFVLLPLAGYVTVELLRVVIMQEAPILAVVYSKFFNESTLSFVGYDTPLVFIKAVIYYLATPLAVLSIAGAWYLWRSQSHAGLLLILGAYLPTAVVTFLTLVASTANRYVFMTLPYWIVLAAFGVVKIVSQARYARRTLWWLVPVILPIIRDPVVKDVRFYMVNQSEFMFLLVAIIPLFVIGVGFLWRRASRAGLTFSLSSFGLVFTLLIHLILMDTMYFAYQDGHRENWKQVAAIVLARIEAEDVIVASQSSVGEYYLQHEVLNPKDVDLESILVDTARVWIIETFEMDKELTQAQTQKINDQCLNVEALDHFVAGKSWKMRIHLCEKVMFAAVD